ncbi:hypothetical protein GGR50DRAFT_691580 [Xylaria sp. CBS 124048]|nr:hypothetical protein GGR50DRAFT_691580 [Xylaria sp. CBS 124048]
MGLIQKIEAKIEIYRLEKRYTLNRHRRATFVSNAMYVDGEYVYQTPSTTGSSTNSSSSSPSYGATSRNMETSPAVEYPSQSQTSSAFRRLKRFSSLAGFRSPSSHRLD